MNWKALAIVASLIIPASTVAAKKPTNDVTKKEWDYVCEALLDQGYDKVDCSKLDPPTVVVSMVTDDVAAPGWVLYGFTYPGEPYVFVNSALPTEEQRQVVVHESVHYVLDWFYGIVITECESEKAARKVQHKWDGTSYVEDTWYIDYQCNQ